MSDAYLRVVTVNGPATTGDFTISASGETKTPKGIILMMSNHWTTTAAGTANAQSMLNVGVSDGTTEGCFSLSSEDNQGVQDTGRAGHDSKIIYQEWAGASRFTASSIAGGSAGPIAGGWIVNVSAETASLGSHIIAWLFFGDDMQCYTGFAGPGDEDEVLTQTPGFQVDGGIVISSAGGALPLITTRSRCTVGFFDYDGATVTALGWGTSGRNTTVSEVASGTSTTTVHQAQGDTGAGGTTLEISNITATQFDITIRDATGVNIDAPYLVWNVGGNAHSLENFTTPTSTGVDAVSTADCSNGVIGLQTHLQTNDTRVTTNDAGAWGVFGADSVAEYSMAVADEDNQGVTDTQSMYDTKILNVPYDDGSTGIVGTVANLSTAGLDVSYTAVEASAKQGFLYSIGQAAPAAAATSGGGRILPPVRKKKPRKTITLKREPKVIPQEPDKVVDLSALIEITESLAKPDAKSEDILPRLADVIAFIPKEGEKREGGEVTAQEAVDSLLLKLAPILKEMDDRVSAVSSKVEASESSVDQLKILVAMEREEAQKEQLVVLLMQLVVLLS